MPQIRETFSYLVFVQCGRISLKHNYNLLYIIFRPKIFKAFKEYLSFFHTTLIHNFYFTKYFNVKIQNQYIEMHFIYSYSFHLKFPVFTFETHNKIMFEKLHQNGLLMQNIFLRKFF